MSRRSRINRTNPRNGLWIRVAPALPATAAGDGGPEKAAADRERERRALALEEWKQLETIIGRYDGIDVSIRGWLLVLIGGLIAARYSRTTQMPALAFLIVSLIAWFAFRLTEGMSRVVKRVAMNRAQEVENYLGGKENAGYSGPELSAKLTGAYSSWPTLIAEELKKRTVGGFYGMLLVMILATATPRVLFETFQQALSNAIFAPLQRPAPTRPSPARPMSTPPASGLLCELQAVRDPYGLCIGTLRMR